ncbi:putative 54S ribosomal protein [Clavispora lusitaniae]|uniref:54S ribosomal protein n=3 Tax=Clavispora lusitaniae TaxID=36911 RepID=C4Y7W4_CLAL4|nr:uncharacterized protein CLUG_04292 [Clavispora lusitaniae ATCC 42720]QFZ29306.1 putative 54S ribosomal protein [Clavispora lusitaniae]EEQ40164.1 hypothetical protein CLUG_04292 [Clavispora lusitaniae ATCC 42720]QFZ34969.1 putative 54S ribosomal protein [Clavispora lusitaniae]QFZ40654.1 putative 54S ribosomal protein [Clavispora lusitaniae]QFZ46334.1 putative 54S ribosomal protein [Clavispora lusitaniae]
MRKNSSQHQETPMNFLRSLALAPVMPRLGCRGFSGSSVALAEKYYKITKYTKPVDTNTYVGGQEMPYNKIIPRVKKLYPEYEYETMFFKRQNRGLYAGLQRKRSKTCSESGNKNNRVHLPNIVRAKLWSETLNKRISARVSTTLLRTVTKEGGLDNYLLKDKPARVKTMGLKAWRLKYDIMKKKEIEANSENSPATVYHVSESGKKITVGRNKLLKALYPLVFRDSYEPIDWNQFLKTHTVLSTEELVQKLEKYDYDFSSITV